MKVSTMDAEKNLHASVPPALLTLAQEAARREHISLDELVSDAMKRRLNRRAMDERLAFGKRHAQERGLKPTEVAAAIDDVRRETSEDRQ